MANLLIELSSLCRKVVEISNRRTLQTGHNQFKAVLDVFNSTQLNSASSENVHNFATGKKLSDHFQYFFS